MSIEEGSVECSGGALVCVCPCVCVRLFCRVLLHWRAAWQNHYGLCKHILTSRLKSALPHTYYKHALFLHMCAHILPMFTTNVHFDAVSVLQMLTTCHCR